MKYYRNLGLRLLMGVIFTIFYGSFYSFIYHLTIYPAYFVINLFYNSYLANNSIFVGGNIINIISACIAGIAYALLLLLILFTNGISLGKSFKMFFVGSLLILIMNIMRIDLLIFVLVEFGSDLFDKVHLIFWNFVSGLYVAFVWIYLVKKFHVKGIPIVSDVKELLKYFH